MPEPMYPGVYVEELGTHARRIEGVPTSTAGFLGASHRTLEPVLISSVREFERYPGSDVSGFVAAAVRGFFENGGQRCYVGAIAAGDSIESGLDALGRERLSILCCPDEHQFPDAAAKIAAHCEQRRDRVCILQSPQLAPPHASHLPTARSSYAAYYHPWLIVSSSDGQRDITVPPGGHIAGAYARVDAEGGVHRAPSGVRLLGVKGLSQHLSAPEGELLVARGINVLHSSPDHGVVVRGGRTTSPDPEWRYINVRRLLVYIEEAISNGMRWVVFEPNGPVLWHETRRAIENFLTDIWKGGGLVGRTPESAFFVRCDHTTMTQSDIDSGRLVVVVGAAPLRPAEYILLRVTAQTGEPRSVA